MATRGNPKKFKNGSELIALFDEFCRDIIAKGYDKIPSQTEFCRWLEERENATDRKTIYNALNKYFPTVKKDFERLQSDLIAQGAMLDKYKNTMSIFVLKNWCKWSDRPIDETDNSNEKIAQSIERLADAIAQPTAERRVEDFE